MRHASTSAQQVRNAAAYVAPRAERIDASVDDPAEGPLIRPSWYLPSSWAHGMARLGTPTAEDVQVIMPARTAVTEAPATRPSDRLVCAAEVTEGMAGPGRTAPAAAIFRMKARPRLNSTRRYCRGGGNCFILAVMRAYDSALPG
jgi:hypothetical protein